MARLLSAGLIYIRLEHYVMGAQPSSRARVMEAVDHFLAFFLSLMAARDETGNVLAKPDKAARKQAARKAARG
jgi:hypothetical protein